METKDVKLAIKKMQAYDLNELNKLAQKSGIELMVINFWFNAIHA